MTATETPASSLSRQLCIALIAVAAWEAIPAAIGFVVALTDFSANFLEFKNETRLHDVAQAFNSAKLVLAPVAAGLALMFALKHRLRQTIFALAALVFIAWVADLPDIFINGAGLPLNLAGVIMFFHRVIYPLLALAAIGLAAVNMRLALAGVLVCMPTALALALFPVFGIGMLAHGF
jgi:hypothetical protein